MEGLSTHRVYPVFTRLLIRVRMRKSSFTQWDDEAMTGAATHLIRDQNREPNVGNPTDGKGIAASATASDRLTARGLSRPDR